MKRLISVFLTLILALGLAGTVGAVSVQRSEQRFSLDGKSVSLDAWNVDGDNYVKPGDLAEALSDTAKRFSVEYDAETDVVSIVTGGTYDPLRAKPDAENVGHLGGIPGETARTLVIDGQAHTGLTVWVIGGNDYYRLRDLQPLLGFGLDYDAATGTVLLTSGEPESKLPIPAKSYQEILEKIGESSYYFYALDDEDYAEPEEAPAQVPAPTTVNASSADRETVGSESGYSGTNVQVEGVDEGDIVKTDGEYIYVLSSEGCLTILKADGKDTRIVSQTELCPEDDETNTYKYPREMFVSDGRLAVIFDSSSYGIYLDYYRGGSDSVTNVEFYDVSDPVRPKAEGSLGQDGTLIASRLLDGTLYLVTRHWVRGWDYDEDEPRTFVPSVWENGAETALPAGCVYICDPGDEYVVVSGYDLAAGKRNETRSLLGGGSTVYMSAQNLYVLGSEYRENEVRTYTESVYTVTEYESGSDTTIHRFALSGGGIELAATGSVPGSIDSQFSADERDGRLRIVTTRASSRYSIYEDETYGFRNYQWGEDLTDNCLYVLDGDLNTVGSVTGLAEGEYVYSVRFEGDVAYFCTFRNTDPLFTVDLSDPTAPKVLGALKITGFSEYLHSWGDGRLFGLGMEADEASGGTEGLKLVMFDASNPTDVRAEHVYRLEDESYSQALYDHKAVFIAPEKNLIGFMGGDGYYLFSYDESAGFRQLGCYEFDGWEWNVRGLYIGEFVYVVGSEQVLIVEQGGWNAAETLEIASPER